MQYTISGAESETLTSCNVGGRRHGDMIRSKVVVPAIDCRKHGSLHNVDCGFFKEFEKLVIGTPSLHEDYSICASGLLS